MSNGKLKWYNPVKGFGFITPDPEGSKADIFVHISQFKNAGIPEDSITEGMALTFDEVEFRGKIVAGNIKRV